MKTILAVSIYMLSLTSHALATDINNSIIIREGDSKLDNNPKVCQLYTVSSKYVIRVRSYSSLDSLRSDIYDSYDVEDNNHLDLINYTYEQALDYIDSGICEGIYFRHPINECEITKLGYGYRPDQYFISSDNSQGGVTYFASIVEREFDDIIKIQSRLSEIGFCKKPIAKNKCLVRGKKGNYSVSWNNRNHNFTSKLKTLKDVKAEKIKLKNAGICY